MHIYSKRVSQLIPKHMLPSLSRIQSFLNLFSLLAHTRLLYLSPAFLQLPQTRSPCLFPRHQSLRQSCILMIFKG